MKFDEWWGTYNAKVIYSVGGVSNTHHREECKAIAHGAWYAGCTEGKKAILEWDDKERVIVDKNEPTHADSKTIGHINDTVWGFTLNECLRMNYNIDKAIEAANKTDQAYIIAMLNRRCQHIDTPD